MGLLGKGFGKALQKVVYGTDYLGEQAQKEALQLAALKAAGLLQPVPGDVRQSQIANDDGEDISAAFGPVFERGPSRMRTPQEIAAGMSDLIAHTPGFNAKQFVDLAQYSKPNIRYDRGFGYDDATGAPAGPFHPELDKGMVPTAEGVRNAQGYVKSAAEAAGAVTSAQEQAKAGYDVIPVKVNGVEMQLPRAVALPLLVKAMRGTGGDTGLPEGFGRDLSPGEKERQVGEAKTAVDRAAAQPQKFSGLQDQARTTSLVVSQIDKALSQISPMTAGMGSLLAGVPMTGARDLKATLDTIRANVGFEQLAKMRENSPTGGALGGVSERENTLLQSVLGALDAGQSPEQLVASLKTLRDQLYQISKQRSDLYKNTYQGGSMGTGQPQMTGRNGSRIISVQ